MDMEGGELGQIETDDQIEIRYEPFGYGLGFSPTPSENDTIVNPISFDGTSEVEHPLESASDQQTDVVNVGELFVGREEFKEMCKEVRELKARITTLETRAVGPFESLQTDGRYSENARGQRMETPPKEDALMTQCILAEVFSYLDFTDLKSARLVCSRWAEASSPRFLEKAKMCACGIDVFERPMSRFEAVFPPPTKFTSLVIEDMAIFSGMMQRAWLLSYCGSLTHVQLGYFVPDTYTGFLTNSRLCIRPHDLIVLLLSNCPNLTELVLPFPSLLKPEEVYWSFTPRPHIIRTVHLQLFQVGAVRAQDVVNITLNFDLVLKMVFECVASLKTLRMENREDVCLKKFFDSLGGSLGAKKVLVGLEELDLSNWTTSSSLLQGLAKAEFQNLKILHLGPFSKQDWSKKPSTLATNIFDLLTSVCSTLEELTLSGPGNYSPLKINLPDLPKLRVFRNRDLAVWGHPSMDFVLKTPNLEILELSSRLVVGKLPPIDILLTPHAQLKTLRLYCDSRKPEDFLLLGKAFPKLEKVVWDLRGYGPDLRACLVGLANQQHVKITILDLTCRIPSDPPIEDLKTAVTALPYFPFLESLQFQSNRRLTGEMFTSAFLKCPKLKRLDLSDAALSPDEDWDAILSSGHGLQIIVPKHR